MKINYENVMIKVKLLQKLCLGNKIKNICKDPIIIKDLLNNSTKGYTSKNEYSSYQVLYRIYNNFKINGFKSLIYTQGMHKMGNKTKKEITRLKEKSEKTLLIT